MRVCPVRAPDNRDALTNPLPGREGLGAGRSFVSPQLRGMLNPVWHCS